jgi:hypothetical protein
MPETTVEQHERDGPVDHRAAHSAREYLLRALDSLEAAENHRDPAEQSNALGLARKAAFDAADVLEQARRQVEAEQNSAVIDSETKN